ncbi:MAG: glycogen debranching protein GlgX [Hydrogenophaga sp.]|nr:glycogen debranching protein GlgX [Hydrogenophaga sp.]
MPPCLQALPLGATVQADGVGFALAAPNAEAVELCLLDALGHTPIHTTRLQRDGQGIWRAFVPGLGAGAVYGYRVYGPWNPAQGQRFNPAKLLLDPYAREVQGRYDGDDIHNGHRADDPSLPDPRDNAATALKARVLADPPPLSAPRPLIDPAQRVLYELHLKAFTALHPGVPEALRGTYAGLAHPAAIQHLKRLGITTVCLMPLAQRADEPRLLRQGLSNHWGYNTIGWAAPETRYASAPEHARSECRAMVDALHAAGLEVVLDVVFNHSAESDETGPTLSLRGIDNALYYHLDPHDRARYVNWAGCGNVLNINQPLVLRLVMDSLRRWVTDFGIDGFRFDLAPILARGAPPESGFQPGAAFLLALAQDPLLCHRLMVAEPWDIGPNGYQLGSFPNGWLEWNDRYRDTQRSAWLNHSASLGALAHTLAGSSAVFGQRCAHSSVNYLTAHDGFTLMDLVSYTERHNQANGENNRDGHGHNLSVNHGVEGPSDDPAVQVARLRQRRALLSVLLLSLGTPMLLAGDELGHSQQGNNNAYCQDNPSTWLHWDLADPGLTDFVTMLIALRQSLLPLLSKWWHSDQRTDPGFPLAQWFQANANQLAPHEWDRSANEPLLLQLGAPALACLLLLNPSNRPYSVQLPPGTWQSLLDSHCGLTPPKTLAAMVELPACCVWLAVRSDVLGSEFQLFPNQPDNLE